MFFRITQTRIKGLGWGLFLVMMLPCLGRAESISVNTGMSFGLIEFTAAHQGELALGTNGAVILTGSGFFYDRGAVPAQITITGDDGIIEFRCSATSTLGGAKAGTLQITDIEASVGVGVGPGAGTPCKGEASSSPDPIILDLGAVPNPKIFLGGTLNIPYGAISNSQSYESDNGVGTPLSVNAVYQ